MANCDLLQATYVGQVNFIIGVLSLLPSEPKAFPLEEIKKVKSYRNIKNEVVSYFPMIRSMILDNDGAEAGNIADEKQAVLDALHEHGASIHSGPVKDALKRLRDHIVEIFPDINASRAVEAHVGELLDAPAGMTNAAAIAAMNHMLHEYVRNVESYFKDLLRELRGAYKKVNDHCPHFFVRSGPASSSGFRSSNRRNARRNLRRTVRRH